MINVFEDIDKPDKDQSTYRYFELANGLRVVAIHDPLVIKVIKRQFQFFKCSRIFMINLLGCSINECKRR